MSGTRKTWLIALGVAVTVGVCMRINNAIYYPVGMGFDATGNWDYIALLLRSWALPAPDQGWSTAHPPFFYNFSAAIIGLLGSANKLAAVHAVRLATAGAGLLGIGAAVLLVRRADPENTRRAFIAGALLLFLPVHLYMSAMLSEEILVTALISLAVVGVAMDSLATPTSDHSWPRAAFFGAIAGLALLTKLSGLLIVCAGVAAYSIDWMRSGQKSVSLRSALVFGAVASMVGGWYYVWNLFTYGYLYPHGLEVHSVMFSMPPGERSVADYLRFPLATFTDPQLLSPNLLRSVWGSTYVTVWFDGHRQFLPKSSVVVERFGTAILLLALVPTVAFAVGLWRGARRLLRNFSGPDVILLLLVASTFAGYILFTWRNPWFAVLKGSFLLGISVPFSYYTSEVLAEWTRQRGLRSVIVLGCLGLLAGLTIGAFTYGAIFEKHEIPGVDWKPVETPWQG